MRSILRPNRLIITVVALLLLIVIVRTLTNVHWRSGDLTTYGDGDTIDFEQLTEFHGNLNETGFPTDIVPNIVHYVRFEDHNLDFIMYISIKSVLINHRPDKVVIHCDCDALKGRYWDLLAAENSLSNKVEVRRTVRPDAIFGQKLSSVFHASDVARIRILMENGGIFLDNDVFVVKSLDIFRHFEMSLGWPINENLGTQVLVAHKNARFLNLWLKSYEHYEPTKWYYNAGELPTKEILTKQPNLVHRLYTEFGVHMLVPFLYKENWPEDEWSKRFYTVHLLSRHRGYLVKDGTSFFNEENIKTYDKTFGSMARKVLFGSSNVITGPPA